MGTYFAKPGEVAGEWYIVNAKDQVLGRLATRIADVLRGKNKPQYTPHVDTGDFVIVVNAEKIKLTGKKMLQKEYIRHSGHPGGFRKVTYEKLLQTKPETAIIKAVKRMVPDSKLGRNQMRKLKVYKGEEHPHAPQKPKPFPGISN
jgi:large subunit ribosomal protein L13